MKYRRRGIDKTSPAIGPAGEIERRRRIEQAGQEALACLRPAPQAAGVISIHSELRALVAALARERVPYALCGALALAVHGYPRATMDIDVLAIEGSEERIRSCARGCGFTLEAAPMTFAGGSVRIQRLSKAVAGSDDVLMLDVLSLAAAVEREITVQSGMWQGLPLMIVSRESLVRLKMLRGNAQDTADVERLNGL